MNNDSQIKYDAVLDDDNIASFLTEKNLEYFIGFVKEEIEEIEIKEFFQFFLTRKTKGKSGNDIKLRNTIYDIFRNFLEQDKNRVIICVCDQSDGKQKARRRLFRIWFETYEHKSEYTKIEKTVSYEKQEMYSFLFLRKDNPKYKESVKEIENFFGFLEMKYEM